MLKISNLSKTYGNETKALTGVSFNAEPGEFIVVLGESGSGKSTLLRCINRLVEPTEGRIFFNNNEITGANQSALRVFRRGIGMVFQNYNLINRLTAWTNVMTGYLGSIPAWMGLFGYFPRESINLAQSHLERVGIGDKMNSRADTLSGGQQQRVGIARSLAIEPDIWFLDEPFSALDPLIRKEMQDEFLRLQGVLNKTILFVTHDFDEALRLADRIAIMKDGVIEQLDTPANIVLNPATEYVHKFTEDVPREKVLKIESVMDPGESSENVGDLRVSKDAIIETVAEAVLSESKAVSVVDSNNRVVGILHPSKVISVLFGGRADHPSQ